MAGQLSWPACAEGVIPAAAIKGFAPQKRVVMVHLATAPRPRPRGGYPPWASYFVTSTRDRLPTPSTLASEG